MAEMPLGRGLRVLEGRSRAITYVICAYIGLSAVMVLTTLGLIGGQISYEGEELSAVSAISALVSIIHVVVFILSAILVAMWIYRGHANLRAADVEGLEFTPGWSVGWFFVPIANLIKPFQAMRELWTVSHAQADSFGREAPPELIPWWASYILGSMLKNMSLQFTFAGNVSYILDGVGSLILIVSAWCLLRIVQGVTRAQADPLSSSHTFA